MPSIVPMYSPIRTIIHDSETCWNRISTRSIREIGQTKGRHSPLEILIEVGRKVTMAGFLNLWKILQAGAN